MFKTNDVLKIPFLSPKLYRLLCSERQVENAPAGLLAFGSPYSPRLPIHRAHAHYDEQWLPAAFVPDHSGGPTPDSHGFPYYSLDENRCIERTID